MGAGALRPPWVGTAPAPGVRPASGPPAGAGRLDRGWASARGGRRPRPLTRSWHHGTRRPTCRGLHPAAAPANTGGPMDRGPCGLAAKARACHPGAAARRSLAIGVHGSGMAYGAGGNRRDAGGVLRRVRRPRTSDGAHRGSRVPCSVAEASAFPDVERRRAWVPSWHRDAESKSSERRSARPYQPRDPQRSSCSVGRPRARVPSHGRRCHHARRRTRRRRTAAARPPTVEVRW